MNLLFQTISVFKQGNEPLGFINALQSAICMNILWPICYRWKQSLSKYVFLMRFLITLTLNIVTASVSEDSPLYVKNFFNESYY